MELAVVPKIHAYILNDMKMLEVSGYRHNNSEKFYWTLITERERDINEIEKAIERFNKTGETDCDLLKQCCRVPNSRFNMDSALGYLTNRLNGLKRYYWTLGRYQ